jgi:hypothetical protein
VRRKEGKDVRRKEERKKERNEEGEKKGRKGCKKEGRKKEIIHVFKYHVMKTYPMGSSMLRYENAGRNGGIAPRVLETTALPLPKIEHREGKRSIILVKYKFYTVRNVSEAFSFTYDSRTIYGAGIAQW